MSDVLRPPRAVVRDLVREAWRRATADGALPDLAEADLPPIEVTRPANPEHGDLTTNLALKLARPLRRPPLAIAEALAAAVRDGADGRAVIAGASAAAPGFLNLTLDPEGVASAVDAARAMGGEYGRVTGGTGQRINVEFVSANPTGPLHIGNARGAFVGDLLCRVLEGAGHQATREYYFNDFGSQVWMLGESVRAIRTGQPLPDDGYRGDYVSDLAERVPDDVWQAATAPDVDAGWVLGRWASDRVREGIEASLERLGAHFDVWRSESTLHQEGWIERGLERLREGGHLYEEDGALWFRSTTLGDDKDRVVRRSNGEYTYFAADIGYLTEKFSRGFDHLVYVWGSDHHGTVARLRNAAQSMGHERDTVEVLLTAWVRFVRDGREVSMSKRSGEFIALDELLDEIGVDAARWFFAARAPSTGIDFDIELAKRRSSDNPVYYVQYAHARIASILRRAEEHSIAAAASVHGAVAGDEAGLRLAKEILRLPEVVEDAAAGRETQGVTSYATELATEFHAYYRDRRVVDPAEPGVSADRLALVDTARLTLANALALLGISAPDSM